MKDRTFRQVFAFALLILTIGWAGFVALLTHHALDSGSSAEWLAASGCTGLLGAMIAWLADIKQFFYRKARTTEDNGENGSNKPP